MLGIYLVREVLEDIAARILATKVTDAQIEPFGGHCRSATKFLKSHPDRY
jgi:DNA-binding GntR family transcriptional regulator